MATDDNTVVFALNARILQEMNEGVTPEDYQWLANLGRSATQAFLSATDVETATVLADTLHAIDAHMQNAVRPAPLTGADWDALRAYAHRQGVS